MTADAMPPGRSDKERERERRRIEDENEELLCRLQALDAQLKHLDAEEQEGEGKSYSAREGARARRIIVHSQVVCDGQGREKQWMANGAWHSAPEGTSLGAASLLNTAMVTRACSCVRRLRCMPVCTNPPHLPFFANHCCVLEQPFPTICNHPSVPLVCPRCLLRGQLCRHCHRTGES